MQDNYYQMDEYDKEFIALITGKYKIKYKKYIII